MVDGIRSFFGKGDQEPRLVTLYVTIRVAALPGGGGFMAEQLHAAEAMRSLFPDVRCCGSGSHAVPHCDLMLTDTMQA